MSADDNDDAPAAGSAYSVTEDGSLGSYTLRELIQSVPLSTDDDGVQAHITCIEAWNGNLYIGTSDGKVLHYVSIPPEEEGGPPVYIFATEIQPDFSSQQTGSEAGVKQILVLPNAGKACIVCNSTLTFYTLPELSPAFEGRIRQAGCLWIGGKDRDDAARDNGSGNGTVVVICLRQRLRLIRIGEEARKIRDIELAGVGTLERRGDLACVADANAYSLLDVVNQRKNELFPISSLSPASPPISRDQDLAPPPAHGRPASRSFSTRSPVRQGRAHQRITSLGGQAPDRDRLRPDSSSPWPARASSQLGAESPAPSSREGSPKKADEAEPAKIAPEAERPKSPKKKVLPLQPNILTPTPNEFLLTTGTKRSDPGVGMFVNLDGDVVRGTLEFSSYPDAMLLDDPGGRLGMPDEALQEGYVLALVQRRVDDTLQRCIEFQRWDTDPGEAHGTKEWLVLDSIAPGSDTDIPVQGMGLRNATTSADLPVSEVSNGLRLRRLQVNDTVEGEANARRNLEEDKLASRFAHVQANVLLYTHDRICWVVREPMISQLDKQLSATMQKSDSGSLTIDVPTVQRVVNSIRGQDPRDELEFLTLTYVRQKAALLLFGNLVLQTASGITAYEHDKRRAEDALTTGEIDPRIVLILVPGLEDEIVEGPGIWLPQGLRDTIDWLRNGLDLTKLDRDAKGAYGDNILGLAKRYLMTWRKKKGFGSVADEANVFLSVDAALLHILLMLDQNSPRGPAISNSIRAELNEVVDKGVDCFDRAVELCEQYHRLFVLSRLHQNRINVAQVLATWRRILEGEKDAGGEMIEGEHDMRKYLSKIRDRQLVQEYGSWLAHRNPRLGVQIFADDTSRVQFDPQEAVSILKQRAPEAVKDYLEHLVFGKNHVQYVNDLIAFYLDTILTELETSPSSRTTLLQSYESYRALRAPKPTYRQFITDNALPAEWFQNRLRLLQLIGGSHGAASKYNVQTLNQRLAPYSNELVPEMIILNGREGKHEEAIHLLTHGLGDYDTAIRYCLLGGSSIFHPSSNLTASTPFPSQSDQSILFTHLLHEFLLLSDLSERLERTSELLERFGAWFDIAEVLSLIPGDWSVELLSGFLVQAFRRLVAEKNEVGIVRALCSAQNLRESLRGVEEMEKRGPVVVRVVGEEETKEVEVM